MTARMNAMVYNGCKSLRTTDNCLKGLLLNNNKRDGCPPLTSDVINVQGRSLLATIGNVLTSKQCNEIIDNCNRQHSFASMLDKYKSSQRNNARLLILDENFAASLWKILEPDVSRIFSDNNLPFQPLGFDVSRGEWKLSGLNEAFRINRYSGKREEFFSIHKDAQYCPNGDRRSLLTMVIYLNDDFSEGATTFYFPKKQQGNRMDGCIGKDMTAQDEIKSLGGLDEGYDAFRIEPSVGKAVIFSHNILHESIPVKNESKYVLKTDVVVKRFDKSYGFAVTDAEKSDYLLCLNHFREAQSQELNGNKGKAGELYERALSIRYCYPMAIESGEELCSQNTDEYSYNDYLLPNNVWQHIFSFMNGKDIENVLKAFPNLYLTQNAWERSRYKMDKEKSAEQPLHIPLVDNQHGISTQFRFRDAFFFSENEEACIRVATMYAFNLLGHRADEQFYTVRYNPETQEVCAVALRSLLTDAFLNRPCFGSLYAVCQQDPLKQDVYEDFLASVDSTYMTLRHDAQFLGGAIGKKMKVKVKWLGVTDKEVDVYIKKKMKEDDLDDCLSDNASTTSDDSDDCDEFKEKILTVTKDNLLEGDAAANEFICFYDTCEQTLSSVPVVIKDVVVFKSLESFLSEFPHDADWLEEYIHEYTTTHRTSPTEELSHDFSSAEELYFENMIAICRRKPGVSAAIITDIESHTRIEEHMCFCYWPGGEGYDKIYQSNKVKCYNHLVFDFSSHQMIIKKGKNTGKDVFEESRSGKPHLTENDGNLHCTEDCIFSRNFYEEFCEKKLEGLSDVFHCKVDISPILEDATGFNHASCNCSVPSFEIEECHNIQDYPALDHIHIVGGVNVETHEVILWTFYGGIAAL